MSGRSKTSIFAILAAFCWAIGPAAAAQEPTDPGRAPWSRMAALLEKTIFRVDVLRIRLCFDETTANAFARIADQGRPEAERGDSIALAALRGRYATARIEFLRDLGLKRFLEGIDEDQRKAVERGFLADSLYHAIRASLPVWFGFLEQRGIRKGDRLHYVLGPEAIRTRYFDANGSQLMDLLDAGRGRRNSVLATWLAPGSSFREGLLRSMSGTGPGAAGEPVTGWCDPFGQGGRPAPRYYRFRLLVTDSADGFFHIQVKGIPVGSGMLKRSSLSFVGKFKTSHISPK